MEQIICSWEIANWHFERKNCFLTASCEVLREFPMIAKTSVFIVVWCLCDACENCESVVWKKQWFSAAPVPKFWFGSVRIKGAKTGLLLVSCSFKAYYKHHKLPNKTVNFKPCTCISQAFLIDYYMYIKM